MNKNARLYKTISSDELSKMNLSINRKYSYCTQEDVKELKEQAFEGDASSNSFQLIDNDYEWNPKINSLFLDLNVNITNPSIIFGLQGSCYDDAIIGVGITWKSEKSKIKNCYKLGEITNTSNPIEFAHNAIEIDNLNSNTTFKLIFYIVKPGTKNGSKYFANEAGMVILEQIVWTIIVEGEGSVFPIFEIADEKGPLWSFNCDFYDITQDAFDKDHIQIFLNTKHPAYSMIHPKSPNYNLAFVREVLSNALASIVLEIRSAQSNNTVDLDLDCEKESILQVLKFYSEKLNFDINGSYSSLVSSIKKYFDKGVSL